MVAGISQGTGFTHRDALMFEVENIEMYTGWCAER